MSTSTYEANMPAEKLALSIVEAGVPKAEWSTPAVTRLDASLAELGPSGSADADTLS